MDEVVEGDLNKDTCSQQQANLQLARLELLNIDEWDKEKTYDKDLLSCIHYLIEWKVTLHNKIVSRDTEQNIVLALSVY
jgi:hypothetical protein